MNAEISAFSSGDLNKSEFLTRKDLNYKPNALEEGVIRLLKEIRDNLAGGINIPAGVIIPPGPQVHQDNQDNQKHQEHQEHQAQDH